MREREPRREEPSFRLSLRLAQHKEFSRKSPSFFRFSAALLPFFRLSWVFSFFVKGRRCVDVRNCWILVRVSFVLNKPSRFVLADTVNKHFEHQNVRQPDYA